MGGGWWAVGGGAVAVVVDVIITAAVAAAALHIYFCAFKLLRMLPDAYSALTAWLNDS